MMPRTLAICNSDSRINWSLNVAKCIDESSSNTLVYAPKELWSVFQEKKIAAKEFHGIGSINFKKLADFDFLIIGLGSHDANDLLTSYYNYFCRAKGTKRPITITGFQGVVFRNFFESVSFRLGSDIVCVNTPTEQAQAVEAFSGIYQPTSSIVHTGIFTTPLPEIANNVGRLVIFATQNDIPSKKTDREYLLERLSVLQSEYPESKVVIKPRNTPTNKGMTNRLEQFGYETLYKEMTDSKRIPANLTFSYAKIEELLLDCQLLITISSTAAIEAASASISTLIASDLGLSDELGNTAFIGSGLIGPIGDTNPKNIRLPNPSWIKTIIADNINLRTRIAEIDRHSPPNKPLLYFDGLSYRKKLERSQRKILESHQRFTEASSTSSLIIDQIRRNLRDTAPAGFGPKILAKLKSLLRI